MEEKPHCYSKMYWVLDEPKDNEKSICNRCSCNIKECLSLTRGRAETLKNEIDSLKKNGKLDVFDKRLSDLFNEV